MTNFIGQPHALGNRQNEHSDRRFAHPAEPERGECNAELRHRERRIKMLCELLGVFRAAAPLRDERLQARGAHLHAAELGRDEESVHKDQKNDEQ